MKNTKQTTSEDLARVHRALKKKFQNKNLIFGDGPIGARVLIISEMPGPDEEKEAKPLVGHSAKLIHRLLKSNGIDTKKVYFTNAVKYITGKTLSPKEIRSHANFLKEEIKSVNPEVVITLGSIALNGVGLRQPLDNVHGRTFNFGSYELIPTFHPTLALKNTQIKNLLELDFAKLKQIMNRPKEN
ncbi:MAG TPA: uracil-DNA glycosylase [Candidatus Paceibacterota bacterium]